MLARTGSVTLESNMRIIKQISWHALPLTGAIYDCTKAGQERASFLHSLFVTAPASYTLNQRSLIIN